MKAPQRKFQRKSESGQTMVEFALVLPTLAILLFGVIQFGIAFNNYITVTDAVRAGARQGAVARYLPPGERVASVEQAVLDASDNLDTSQLGISVSVSPDWEPGADVVVTATYPYNINLLGQVIASGNLESSTTERVE
ncbi:MAG: TadE/TadG family type IV pilus assembly protein [Gaiellales bacterium]